MPKVSKRYAAFCVVLVTEPSIVQFHVVGVPVDVSVKDTGVLVVEGLEEEVKEADMGEGDAPAGDTFTHDVADDSP